MDLNALRWDGGPGHYEVHYVTLTDGASGVGAWIRLTLLAPLTGDATCSLWFAAMDPARGIRLARKADRPAAALAAAADPFLLRVGEAQLTDTGTRGAFDDVAWDLSWPPGRPYEHVHPLLRRARVAQTTLVLPHADVAVTGSLTFADRTLPLDGARGGQAHLWGTRHARRWAWAHGAGFRTPDGEPRPDCFVDGVSVVVARLGREVGPSTPLVGRFRGRDFRSTDPVRVVRNGSVFGLTSWRFDAVDRDLRVAGVVDARREELVGVTYRDPDGELVYCYNSEVATMRVRTHRRSGRHSGRWEPEDTLIAEGCAHFEYAQREPVPGVELLVP